MDKLNSKFEEKLVGKVETAKKMEIESILLKANESKEESLFITEDGNIEIRNELSSLLDKPIDNPEEKYELYYNVINKILKDYLPKGKENGRAREVIYASNPQLSPSTSFLRVHVLSLLNYQIN